jgi:hypothetical protein
LRATLAVTGEWLSERPGHAGPLCVLRLSGSLADVEIVRFVGLLLLVGAALSLALHLLGAPEHLYVWSYHHLLSGLDVPEDPSQGTMDAVRYTSLIGGLLELVAGVGLLVADGLRQRLRSVTQS